MDSKLDKVLKLHYFSALLKPIQTMMKSFTYTLLCCSLLFLFSCKSDAPADSTATPAEQVDANKKLIDSYLAKVTANPTNHEENSKFLAEAANINIKAKNFGPAVQYISQAIRDHYPASGTANHILSLANIYSGDMKAPAMGNAIKSAFVKAFPDNPKAGELKSALGSANIEDMIDAASKALYNEETKRINQAKAREYINLCEIYAMTLPNEAKAPEYLFKAGETARSIRQFPKAIDIYNWIYNKFQGNEKAPQALFLKAFTLDNDLKQKDAAKKLYEEFLKKYPTNDFADDTEFLLKNLGVSDDDIIKGFGK